MRKKLPLRRKTITRLTIVTMTRVEAVVEASQSSVCGGCSCEQHCEQIK